MENHPLNIEQKSLWAYGWSGQDGKEKNPSLSQQLECGYVIHKGFTYKPDIWCPIKYNPPPSTHI